MPIALPEINGRDFLKAVVDAAEIARAMQSQTGDLSYAQINRLQEADARIRDAYTRLAQDAGVLPSLVQAYLADRGGPRTLGAAQTAANQFSTAMTAWQALVLTEARKLSSSDLIRIAERQTAGGTLRTIEANAAIPGAAATALRQSSQLAAVITALEAMGA